MSKSLEVNQLIERISDKYDGLVTAKNWGETGLFYNPANKLAKGVYFLTFKEKDGPNDKSSNIDREGVYRLNLGISKDTFTKLFCSLPARPPAGDVVKMVKNYDFATLDKIMPHPVYAWFAWVCVLNPTEKTYSQLEPLIAEGYQLTLARYAKKKL